MARGRPARKVVKKESDNEESDPEVAAAENVEEEDDKAVVGNVKETPCMTKMFVVPKELDGLGWENISIVTLPHPRTNNPALFLINKSSSESASFLYEILTFDQPYRSFFVDDETVSDGNLRMVTPIDPLFVIIPLMSKSSKARPLSDHFCESLSPDVADMLCLKLNESQLTQISNKRVAGDITAYAYSEDLALTWLEKKVLKTVAFLTEKNITRMESSISSNFSSASVTKRDDQEYLRYASDIVGDYLESSLKKKLLVKLGLPAESERKRKPNGVAGETEDNSLKKKQKVTAEETDGVVQPLEDYSSPASNANSPANAPKGAKAKLQKAAQGSHSLFKFFSPKQ